MVFQVLEAQTFRGLTAPLVAAQRLLPAVGDELGRVARLARPDTMLASSEGGLPGILKLSARLEAVINGQGTVTVLDAEQLGVAIPHLGVLTAIFGASGGPTGAPLTRAVGSIDRALGGDGKVDIIRLVAIEDELSYLASRR